MDDKQYIVVLILNTHVLPLLLCIGAVLPSNVLRRYEREVNMEFMFLEALQSYYAPTVLLAFFSFLLATDQLLTRREKKLFLMELGIVALMLLSTWIDRCVSAVTVGEWWRLRFFTSVMQFAAAPLSPMILLWIYRRNQFIRMGWRQCLPAIITALLSTSSFWTGLVLRVEPGNIYSRGPLFLLPFLTSAIYAVYILYTVSRQETHSRRLETIFLICAGTAITGACTLEIVFVIRYMIWSTTAVMLMTYYLLITMIKVLFDSQTEVYSRLAYKKRLESIKDGQPVTLAMIDMNGLKKINDCCGHGTGDQAIICVSRALSSIFVRGKKLYRYGGDEFVIVVNRWCGKELEESLEQIASDCGKVNGITISFAYGVVEYRGGDLHTVTDEVDRLMYKNKMEMKTQQSGSDGKDGC